MHDDRVLASLVAPLVAAGSALGMDADELLAIAGISAQQLGDPDALVSYEAPLHLWEALVQRFPDVPLGLSFARDLDDQAVASLGVVGHATRNCRDVRQSLELFIRFVPLSFPRMTLDLEVLGEQARLVVDHEPRLVALVEPIEVFVATMVRQLPHVNPRMPRPTEVCFRHPRKHPAALYAEVLGAPVRFEAGWSGFAFEAAALALPVTGADPRIGRYLRRHADAMLVAREPVPAEQPLEARVRAVIDANLLAGKSDQAHVAHVLGMSTRSLQRGLKARGTSFAGQLEEVRRSRAQQLLRRPELSVAEVAFMLGYGNPRAFHRSFRRWTGQTPSEYRRAHAG
ncbi:AraC family transcriptional regulator [Paraliomyxa miuraensis]|uniref:AraC family transcriptional regulator n=1 Tax=Paraliomyxa miuraensis TaxID=376150 RepID=UPI0022551F03|nr:AraC family transcriptional regulator [Paraliomyxa miuraensis]MCX4242246.1 AraC family transcriptional regulator [Paraliomyxa miuraensis]